MTPAAPTLEVDESPSTGAKAPGSSAIETSDMALKPSILCEFLHYYNT
jgi:hypothetical protein